MRHANYRYLWLGQLGSASTNWMEQVAYGWLILELTDSAVLLGMVGMTRALPAVFFAIWGGVLADRLDRRRVLLVCQAIIWTLISALALLTTLGFVQVWQVFAVSLGTGIAQAFAIPARQSIVSDSVATADLGNAIALNSLAFNISRVLGPSLAGIVVAWRGSGAVFWIESIIMVAVLSTTMPLRLPVRTRQRRPGSALQDFMGGIVFVRDDRHIRSLLLLLLVPVVFAWPYQYLLPLVARDVLEVGPEGLGMLMSAAGGGALTALALLVFAGDLARRRLIQFGGALGFGTFLILFSRSTNLVLSLCLLGVAAGCSIAYNVINQTMVQTSAPAEVRGRVLGIYQVIMGLTPIGSVFAGALTEQIGVSLTLTFMGLTTVAILLALIFGLPELRPFGRLAGKRVEQSSTS